MIPDRHNAIQNLNYYLRPDPPLFSLLSTFKARVWRRTWCSWWTLAPLWARTTSTTRSSSSGSSSPTSPSPSTPPESSSSPTAPSIRWTSGERGGGVYVIYVVWNCHPPPPPTHRKPIPLSDFLISVLRGRGFAYISKQRVWSWEGKGWGGGGFCGLGTSLDSKRKDLVFVYLYFSFRRFYGFHFPAVAKLLATFSLNLNIERRPKIICLPIIYISILIPHTVDR